MYKEIKYLPGGDRALYMEFGDIVSPEINKKIRSSIKAIEEEKIVGIEELIPTYRSILIIYNPIEIDYENLVLKLKDLAEDIDEGEDEPARIFEIPTIYGGEYGPDIEYVADYNDLSVDEVVKIHTSKPYLIYMLGFTPGFTYLGGMDERIETPRLETPRTKIPAGSTGIAGSQTGIYPIDSPGGWQLIGRTPLKLYDPLGEEPVFLSAGDYVQFVEVDENEYKSIEKSVKDDTYKITIREEEI